jgi:hypothetical protein
VGIIQQLSTTIVDRLATLWRSSASDIMEFEIPQNCSAFRKKYNSVQQSIEQISILDELLAGSCVMHIQVHGFMCSIPSPFMHLINSKLT